MRIARLTAGTAMALSLTLAPVDAAPKGKAPTKVSSKAAPSPKATGATAKAPKAPKTTTASASGTSKAKAPKAAKGSQTKLAKAEAKAARKSGTTASTTTPSTTTPTTTATVDFTQGKVGQKLTKNTKLAEKMGAKLAAMGYTGDVLQAAYGFKNLGQFNAAINNAQNHNLSFDQLKTLMTGVSVDADGVVLYANRNLDGTVTMVPLDEVTALAPTSSLGQAKQILATAVVEPEPTAPTTTTVSN